MLIQRSLASSSKLLLQATTLNVINIIKRQCSSLLSSMVVLSRLKLISSLPQLSLVTCSHSRRCRFIFFPLSDSFANSPQSCVCPRCGQYAVTKTQAVTGNITHLWALGIGVLTLLCCIPYCVSGVSTHFSQLAATLLRALEQCKDVKHLQVSRFMCLAIVVSLRFFTDAATAVSLSPCITRPLGQRKVSLRAFSISHDLSLTKNIVLSRRPRT